MERVIKHPVSDNNSVIEISYTYDNQKFVAVYVSDKTQNRNEFIGTAFEGFTHEFNSKYVIFKSEEGIEIVFDIDAFDYIFNEELQMRAYSKMIESSLLDETRTEKEEHILRQTESTKRRLVK